MSNVTYKDSNSDLRIWVTCSCPECDGEGHYESGPECSRPASECCGGCYKTYKCETCDGGGKVMTTLTPETIGEIIDSLLHRDLDGAREIMISNTDINEG